MAILGAPLLFTACATVQPPQPPSLDLPRPPADLRAGRKGDRVTLTWTVPTLTTDRQTARNFGPTRICRGLGTLNECGTPIDKTPSRLSSSSGKSGQKISDTYSSTLPADLQNDPASFIAYAVEVSNSDGRAAGLSNQVRVPLARTLPPPTDFQAQVTSRGVVLNWKSDLPTQSEQPPAHYVVRVYRRAISGGEQNVIGEAPARGNQSLTDTTIEWENTYEYHADTVTVVDQPDKPEIQVEGDDTPTVKVFADDVFPPAVPSGLQAAFSGPGQKLFIDLVWAPVTDIDLGGYNLYRAEDGTAQIKLNPEPLKTPAYRDSDVVSGKQYVYSVSSVDVRGNESAHSEPATESVP
jgi:hypothetical protein